MIELLFKYLKTKCNSEIIYEIAINYWYIINSDFVCLYNYEFWISLCKIVRSSIILLLPLFDIYDTRDNFESYLGGLRFTISKNYYKNILTYWKYCRSKTWMYSNLYTSKNTKGTVLTRKMCTKYINIKST